MAAATALYCAQALAAQSVLERSEAAAGRMVGNYRLTDQDGRSLPFFSLRGKPVLLNFIYADCPDECPLITRSIESLLREMPAEMSAGVAVLSVTLNPGEDTPEVLRRYAAGFRKNFPHWRFAVADEATLAMMVADLGFTYEKKEGGIAHLNRLTLLDASGRVARHFYGTSFNRREVEDALAQTLRGETLGNRFSVALDRILLYCSTYDAAAKRYRVDYKFLAVWGVQYLLVLGTAAFFIARKFRRTS